MSDQAFAAELSKIPYGVSVVTVGLGGTENGLTVSWLTQVSFDPPMLLFAIDRKHYSTELVEDVPRFVVNLLREGQGKIAGQFARASTTKQRKIDQVPTRQTKDGLAILSDALAYYECEVVARYEAGDHFLVVGQVTEAAILADGAPLTSAAGIHYKR
jgi:flavin reductase (DIM6/NTAB) family NADH-FMN oxidoreductase RutF